MTAINVALINLVAAVAALTIVVWWEDWGEVQKLRFPQPGLFAPLMGRERGGYARD